MKSLTIEEVERQNVVLRETGQSLFGESATLRIVDPGTLLLRRENARFFKKEVFRQLVENIRADARLSSVPLCMDKPDGCEVLSGTHRVKGSVQAGIPWILVMVIVEPLEAGRQLAIQLSHNALVGQDDPGILAALWAKIDDVRDRLYAGLSSDVMQDLEKIKLVQFTTPGIATRVLTFAFVAEEAELVDRIVAELSAYKASDAVYVAALERFDPFFAALQAVKKRDNVKNASLAMLHMVRLAQRGMEVDQ